jgi:hypothetical protein
MEQVKGFICDENNTIIPNMSPYLMQSSDEAVYLSYYSYTFQGEKYAAALSRM